MPITQKTIPLDRLVTLTKYFPRKKDAHAAYVTASVELNREFARAL